MSTDQHTALGRSHFRDPRIRPYVRALAWKGLVEGFLWAALVFLSGAGLATLGIFPVSLKVLQVLSAAALAAGIVQRWRHLVTPLAFARYLREIAPQTEDYLSLVELQQKGDLPSPYRDRLLVQVQQLFQRESISIPWSKAAILSFVGSVMFLLVTVVARPHGLVRWLYLQAGQPDPWAPYAFVLPGNAQVLEGDPVRFHIELYALPHEVPVLVFNDVDTLRLVSAAKNAPVFEAQRVFPSSGTVRYRVVAGTFQSPTYQLRIDPHPLVEGLQGVVQYPAYTGWPTDTLSDPYVLDLLEGSVVQFHGELRYADTLRIYADTGALLLTTAGPEVRFTWAPAASGALHFVYTLNGRTLVDSSLIRARVTPDDPPKVTLLFPPAEEVELPQDEKVPVFTRVEDDYGLQRIEIEIEFQGGTSRVPMRQYKARDIALDTLATQLDLSPFGMMPGDELVFFVRAQDWKGQWGESPHVRVRFPTLAETYEQAAEATEAGEQTTADLQQATETLLEEIQKLSERIKSQDKVGWNEQQQLRETLQQQQEVLKRLSEAAQTLNQTLQNLQALNQLDPEIAEKAARISELFQEVMTEKLRKSLEKLHEALQKVKPEEVQKALEELQQNQEALKEALERMEQILERFKQEIRFAQLEERLDALLESQQRLKEQTEETTNPEELQALAQQQQVLTQELQDIREEMTSLAQELQAESPDIADTLAALAENEAQAAEGAMETAQQELSKGAQSEATSSQRRAIQSLAATKQKISRLRQQFSGLRKQEIAEKIRRLRRSLIFLSEVQSQVLQSLNTDGADPLDLGHRVEGVREGLTAALQALKDLSRQTLMLSLALGAMLDQAREVSGQAAMNLGLLRPSAARAFLEQSQTLLNRVVLILFQSESRLSQSSGSSTGLDQMLQQLAELANQQMSLNMQGQSILPLPSPIPSSLQQQLAQMAAQQAAIRQALQQLQQMLGDQGLMSALEGAQKAMKEAEEALRQGRYDEEVLKKQEKALERLLQAERSIRKREFARQRKSQPGKPYEYTPPSSPSLAASREKIKRALLQLDRQRVDPAYRALIEAYLRTLLKQAQ